MLQTLGPAQPEAKRRESWIGLFFLQLLLIIVPVPFGSSGVFAMPISILLLSLWCIAVFLTNWRFGFLSFASLLVATGLSLYLVLQCLPAFGWLRSNPIWDETSALLGSALPHSVSITPALSLGTLPIVILPVLVFSATMQILREDRQSVALMRFMAWTGTATALFGILQLAISPNSLLLLFDKRHDTDSLTSVFVNRNTAAAFLGCTLILLIGLLASALDGRRPLKTFVSIALEDTKTRTDWLLLSYIAATFVVVVALFLTKSRAGIASTGAAFVLMTLPMTGYRQSQIRRRGRDRALRIGQTLGLASIVAFLFLLLMGSGTLRRVQVRGLDDARFCFYGDIWRAGQEAWPLGTGAGTFQIAFGPFRDPACGIFGMLDRAHNVYLEGLMTIGIAFVVAALVVYGSLLATMIRGVIERQRLRYVPASGLAILLLISLHDLLDFSIQIPAVGIWVAVMMAIACATAFRVKSKQI